MEKFKLLVVSEGFSDFEIIKIIIAEIGRMIGVEFRCELLSPAEDATTRVRERGGWGSVRAWCRNNGKNAVLDGVLSEDDIASLRRAGLRPEYIPRRNIQPKWPYLLTMQDAALLMVHLDADIAGEIVDLAVHFSMSGVAKKEYCRKAIQHWIGASEDESLLFIVSTQCIETWFFALHDKYNAPEVLFDGVNDYEEVEDISQKLLDIGYSRFVDSKNNKPVIDKIKLTEIHGDKFRKNYQLVESRCSEVKRVRDRVSEIFTKS